jgi:hypothetical protein
MRHAYSDPANHYSISRASIPAAAPPEIKRDYRAMNGVFTRRTFACEFFAGTAQSFPARGRSSLGE